MGPSFKLLDIFSSSPGPFFSWRLPVLLELCYHGTTSLESIPGLITVKRLQVRALDTYAANNGVKITIVSIIHSMIHIKFEC